MGKVRVYGFGFARAIYAPTHVPPTQLIDSFCARQSMDERSVKFLFEGNQVKRLDTPEQLDAP